MLGLRLSTFFGALCLIYGLHMTYLPVWLDWRGLTSTEIAIALSAPMLIRVVLTPSVAFIADRGQVHREMIIAACVTAFGLLLALNAASGKLVVIGAVVAMQMALQTMMPLADTMTMAAVKERGLDYGRIRLWGSLTFIVGSYAAGWAVLSQGPGAVLYLSISAVALAAAAALWLPKAESGTARGARLTPSDAIALAGDRRFLLFLATVGALQASHAMLYVFGVLHWRSLGLSANYIASLWAISVVAEIILFWAARWVTPLGAVPLILIGAVAGVVRWTALAFDPAPWLLVPLQILHAGTFAATHLGAMHWIGARIPAATAGTAQALLSASTAGLAMSMAMLASGPLFAAFAGKAYLAMTVASAMGLAAALLLARAERE